MRSTTFQYGTTRRALLKQLGLAPAVFHAAPLFAHSGPRGVAERAGGSMAETPFHESHVVPNYPARSPLEDVLRLVRAGSDEYVLEQYAVELEDVLRAWGRALTAGNPNGIKQSLDASVSATDFSSYRDTKRQSSQDLETAGRQFTTNRTTGQDALIRSLRLWLGADAVVDHADFEITSIAASSETPSAMRIDVRYDMLTRSATVHRRQHVGSWNMEWTRNAPRTDPPIWKLLQWYGTDETIATATAPIFLDVTEPAFGGTASYREQLLHGADHWRSVLDGACGIDVYGNNGVAAGDFDADGLDDLYVCQPAGLPNRLYRNRGDGTFEDVTEKAGVGVLDNTSCALFADLRNTGLQDLVVVCGSGPLLFLNQGNGTFQLKGNAFQFTTAPQGTFTHAAVADYDLDGRLDVYFCVYSYYLGLDQYHYPVPYYDARNGPPNFLFHNRGDGSFEDRTEAAGLNRENDRYSFACAWGQASDEGAPDLYVVNDFGRNVLYRNNGDGTFRTASSEAHVEDVGAGMSAAWADTSNSGRSDLYVANMWSAAGQRVSQQDVFQAKADAAIKDLYRRHAKGNALYRNAGAARFSNAGAAAHVDTGRWAWSSDFWDFDHDGLTDLYVTNGYITEPHDAGASPVPSGEAVGDLGSFFWRQVVAKSPNDASNSTAYEHGWNALNELIRSDHSWSGRERNVMFSNNGDGTFTEVSGAVGLDLLEDSRAFALADFDGDGRLEVAIKNRNAPQLRLMRNVQQHIGNGIAIRLTGTRSNRDAIGAAVTVEVGSLRQKKYLQAGSGFLSQHSKELFFGLGQASGEIKATVRWPSGLVQTFGALPVNSRVSLREGSAKITSRPFRKPANALTEGLNPAPAVQQVPEGRIATWLIEPLRAPAFVLNDSTGKSFTLLSTRGTAVLLVFCSGASATSREMLSMLNQHTASLLSNGLRIVALIADSAARPVPQQPLTFPVLQASEEVSGVYNIIYRYLFDRHRDLPLPSAWLLDQDGMVVKLYQGGVTPAVLLHDVKTVPRSVDERLRAGLPFAGTRYQTDFKRNDFTYGVALFQHGYLDQAEASFQQVVASRPTYAEGYYNLGTLNLRKSNYGQAKSYLQKTLGLKPDYPEAWNNLGMIAAQGGDLAGAVQNFQQSLQLRPSYAVALLNLGNAYRRQGDTGRAAEALTRAVSLQPGDPEANYSLGLFYAQAGTLAPAEDYLQRAIALRPAYPEALNNLGVLHVRKQEYDKASQLFRLSMERSPTFEQSYLNLARVYVVQHRIADARDALQQLLKVRPGSTAAAQALQALEGAR